MSVETGYFVLSVDSRLRVIENRVLGEVVGIKRGVETGEWRKLHNELHDLYCTLDVIRVIKEDEIGGACSRYGGQERRIKNFSEKYSRPRHKWRDNITMYLREIVWESVNQINLAQNITSAGIL